MLRDYKYQVGDKVWAQDEGWNEVVIHQRFFVWDADMRAVPVYRVCQGDDVWALPLGEGELKPRE